MIVSGSFDHTVRVWDAATGQPVGQPLAVHSIWASAVAVGRAGGRDVIVSGSEDGTVRVWDAATGQPVAQQQFPDPIRSLALGGQILAVAQGNDVVVLRINRAIMRVTGMSAGQEGVS